MGDRNIQLLKISFCFNVLLTSLSLCAADIVSSDENYIGSIKIYNTGIKEDPVSGGKIGKGVQSLNSSYWIKDLGCFIAKNLPILKHHLHYAYKAAQEEKGIDSTYFCNQANQLFCKAENEGLQSKKARDCFMMASWLAMAAAEVDDYNYSKYSKEEREVNKEAFYQCYFSAVDYPENEFPAEKMMGIFFAPPSRIDMIPHVALERLGLHNELCAIKFADPTHWKREGFPISKRISSLKRHFDAVHAKKSDEDHVAHLIWNFMAIYHVLTVHPELNDLTNYEVLRTLPKV
ncbi:MAG: hypothetical protein ACI9S8_001075 [Chlamydiales bacterium]|jgi:hypothetical protein